MLVLLTLEMVIIGATTTNLTQVLLCVMLNFGGVNEKVVGRKLVSLGLTKAMCLLLHAMASPFISNVRLLHLLCLSIVLHIGHTWL